MSRSNHYLDHPDMTSVMSVVYQSDSFMLDDIKYMLQSSYEEARDQHGLHHMPLTLMDCIDISKKIPGVYVKGAVKPILRVGEIYGVFSEKLALEPAYDVEFTTVEELIQTVKGMPNDGFLTRMTAKHSHRRFTTSDLYGRDVHQPYVVVTKLYPTIDQIKIEDLRRMSDRGLLSLEPDKETILYQYLQDVAVDFMSSAVAYRNGKSFMTGSVHFGQDARDYISEEIDQELRNEDYGIMMPLHNCLKTCRAYPWSYYKTTLVDMVFTINRHEDYRVAEWYESEFEKLEIADAIRTGKITVGGL